MEIVYRMYSNNISILQHIGVFTAFMLHNILKIMLPNVNSVMSSNTMYMLPHIGVFTALMLPFNVVLLHR